MVPDEIAEDLPSPRAPHLGHAYGTWLPSSEGTPSIASTTPLPSLATVSTDQMLRKISLMSNKSEPANSDSNPGENASLTSFKTCPSDSNLSSLVPRQVAESYKPAIPLPRLSATPTNKSTLATPTPPPPPTGSAGPTQPQRAASTPASESANSATATENVIGGVRHLVRER